MYKNVDFSYILSNFNIKTYEIEKIKEKISKKPRIVYIYFEEYNMSIKQPNKKKSKTEDKE